MKSVLKQCALLAAIASGTTMCLSQNLVINPGFDVYGKATNLNWLFGGDMFTSYAVTGWSQSTSGSSDFFFYVPEKKAKNINPYAGDHDPASGNAFAGFIPWVPGREYREYVTGELSTPLEKGKKYKFRMKVCTGSVGSYLVNDLGVYFSKDRVKDTSSKLLRVNTHVWLDATGLQSNPEEWTVMENVYIAQGGERFFTIGNFLNDSATVSMDRKLGTAPLPYSYYYADDVEVIPTTEDPVAPGPKTSLSNQIKAGSTFIARGVNFDLDKSTLRPESYLQLHEIIAELKRKPGLKVDVRGYTDSTGNEAHNLQLSKARAKVVADYLVSSGIDRSRVTYNGYGSAEPLAGVDPVLNRRVEFRFR